MFLGHKYIKEDLPGFSPEMVFVGVTQALTLRERVSTFFLLAFSLLHGYCGAPAQNALLENPEEMLENKLRKVLIFPV
jgi:hypothetical protein